MTGDDDSNVTPGEDQPLSRRALKRLAREARRTPGAELPAGGRLDPASPTFAFGDEGEAAPGEHLEVRGSSLEAFEADSADAERALQAARAAAAADAVRGGPRRTMDGSMLLGPAAREDEPAPAEAPQAAAAASPEPGEVAGPEPKREVPASSAPPSASPGDSSPSRPERGPFDAAGDLTAREPQRAQPAPARPEPARPEPARPEPVRSVEPKLTRPEPGRPERSPAGGELPRPPRPKASPPPEPELLPEKPRTPEPASYAPAPVRRRRLSATARFYTGLVVALTLLIFTSLYAGYRMGAMQASSSSAAAQAQALRLDAQCLRDVKTDNENPPAGVGSQPAAYAKVVNALTGANHCAQISHLPYFSPADFYETSGVKLKSGELPSPDEALWRAPESNPPRAGNATGIAVRSTLGR